jgi:hypothetical protein
MFICCKEEQGSLDDYELFIFVVNLATLPIIRITQRGMFGW